MSARKEAMLYDQLPDNKVECRLCARRCVIPEGSFGFCGVRKNEGGRLYALNYSKLIAANVDPIGKKPLAHFNPGSSVFSIATIGCNFRCRFCISGDTLLPILVNGEFKLMKAKELDSLFQNDQELAYVEDRDLYVLGYKGPRKIVMVSRRNSDDVLYKIMTERGKSVTLTGDHRIMIWSENKIEAKKVSEIKIGDKVMTHVSSVGKRRKIVRLNLVDKLVGTVPPELLRHVYVSNVKPILDRIKRENNLTFAKISSDLGIEHRASRFSSGIMPITTFAELTRLYKIKDEELIDAKISVRGSPYRIPVIFTLTPCLARLMGYFTAEGNYGTRYNLVLTNKNEALLRDMRKCIENSFDTFVTESRPNGRVPQLIFGGKVIFLLWRYVFEIPAGSVNMKIPNIIFNVGRNLMKEFFSGYTTGDGVLCKRKDRNEVWVRFVTASRLLGTQICFFLNMNGIPTSIRALEHSSSPPSGWAGTIKEWRIDVYGHENIKKLSEICTFLDERQRIIESYIKSARSSEDPVDELEEIVEVDRVNPAHKYVYDITLENGEDWRSHTFFVNEGILIHNCDNWVISQEREIIGQEIPPPRIVEMAKENECQGISYTYTEPTIFFEICYDAGKIAHEQGLFNTWVTNGYLTLEAVQTIKPYLDAATVDFKGAGDPEFYKTMAAVPTIEPILECLKEMKRQGIYIEITNLVVPRYGDSLDRIRELASWIRDYLGKETTFHLLRFHPDYKLTDVPYTPTETLEKAREVAMEYLDYVLLGNVPGHVGENTYCPNCKRIAIRRFGFDITKWDLDEENRCRGCGHKIPIVGKYYPGGVAYPFPII